MGRRRGSGLFWGFGLILADSRMRGPTRAGGGQRLGSLPDKHYKISRTCISLDQTGYSLFLLQIYASPFIAYFKRTFLTNILPVKEFHAYIPAAILLFEIIINTIPLSARSIGLNIDIIKWFTMFPSVPNNRISKKWARSQ